MNIATFGLAATIALATSVPAFAQPAGLDDLDADRINANQITVEFDYQGGACEEVGPAELGEVVDGTLAVNFTVIPTSEICTQQIVEVEVEQSIEADSTVTRLDVTLTGANGSIIATGSTDVDND